MSSEQSRRLIVISHPRTASNLLLKILNTSEQPDISPLPPKNIGGGFFHPSIKVRFEPGLRAKRICEWTAEERSAMMQTCQKCLDELEEYAERAKNEGRIAFFKDHSLAFAEPTSQTQFCSGEEDPAQEEPWSVRVPESYSSARTRLNNTLLPDDYLKSWLPTFVIRHPAVVFPSYYRVLHATAGSEDEMMQEGELINTFHWTRSIYDCYTHSFKINAIILDADDIISKPEILLHYCKIVGMDTSKLKFTWNAKSTIEDLAANKERDPQHRPFMATMDTSSGILKEKLAANIDINLEAKKWRQEFGERAGSKLEEWVIAAIPDYTYLSSRRLRVQDEGSQAGISN